MLVTAQPSDISVYGFLAIWCVIAPVYVIALLRSKTRAGRIRAFKWSAGLACTASSLWIAMTFSLGVALAAAIAGVLILGVAAAIEFLADQLLPNDR
jgi:hypothetical protein